MPTRLNYHSKTLLFVLEDTYNIIESHDASINAVKAFNIEITPLQADILPIEHEKSTLGAKSHTFSNRFSSINFSVYLTSGYGVDHIPAWDSLIQACGFTRTQHDDGSQHYNPSSYQHISGTLYIYIDGLLHVMAGCKGNIVLNIQAGQYPIMTFNFIGDEATFSHDSPPSNISFDQWQAPYHVSSHHTPICTIFGYAPFMRGLTIDAGVNLIQEDLVNGKTNNMVTRNASAQVLIDAPSPNDANYMAIIAQQKSGSLQLQHGTKTGDIVTILCPNIQAEPVSYNDQQGHLGLSLTLSLIPILGDDELSIIAH